MTTELRVPSQDKTSSLALSHSPENGIDVRARIPPAAIRAVKACLMWLFGYLSAWLAR